MKTPVSGGSPTWGAACLEPPKDRGQHPSLFWLVSCVLYAEVREKREEENTAQGTDTPSASGQPR